VYPLSPVITSSNISRPRTTYTLSSAEGGLIWVTFQSTVRFPWGRKRHPLKEWDMDRTGGEAAVRGCTPHARGSKHDQITSDDGGFYCAPLGGQVMMHVKKLPLG